MGDKIIIDGIEVIYNGLFQIDLRNTETNKVDRVFVEPDVLFGKIGQAMKGNYEIYMENNFKR